VRSRDEFEVRVSRKFLVLITSVGLLFFLVGLDLAFLHVVFTPDVDSGKVVLKWIFSIFAIGIGALIVVSQVWYLVFPPLMMRVSSEGVSFGTGFRYRQECIPLKYLESVQTFRTESMLEIWGKTRVVEGGVELRFERAGEIPGASVTSAGISYSDYTLRLNKAYMNRSPSKIVEVVSGFIRSKRLR